MKNETWIWKMQRCEKGVLIIDIVYNKKIAQIFHKVSPTYNIIKCELIHYFNFLLENYSSKYRV